MTPFECLLSTWDSWGQADWKLQKLVVEKFDLTRNGLHDQIKLDETAASIWRLAAGSEQLEELSFVGTCIL